MGSKRVNKTDLDNERGRLEKEEEVGNVVVILCKQLLNSDHKTFYTIIID